MKKWRVQWQKVDEYKVVQKQNTNSATSASIEKMKVNSNRQNAFTQAEEAVNECELHQ